MIAEFNKIFPQIGKKSWIVSTASVIGEVKIGEDCGVWFGAVIRGDVNFIRIGDRTNIQDLSMIHVTHYTKPDKSDGYPTIIGDDVTIGHKVMIHGATISDACLIGMNAVLLDGCRIGTESIVGAGSLVTGNKEFPPRSLILGSPAKVVRELTKAEISQFGNKSSFQFSFLICFPDLRCCLISEKINDTVCSKADKEFASGVVLILIFLRLAAFTSILSKPLPALIINLRLGNFSIISLVIIVFVLIIMISILTDSSAESIQKK